MTPGTGAGPGVQVSRRLLEAEPRGPGRALPRLAARRRRGREPELEPVPAASGEPSARLAGRPGFTRPATLGRRPGASRRGPQAGAAVAAAAGPRRRRRGYGSPPRARARLPAEACLEAGFPRLIACEADAGALAAAFRLRDLSALSSPTSGSASSWAASPRASSPPSSSRAGPGPPSSRSRPPPRPTRHGSSARGEPPSAGTPRARSTRIPCAASAGSGCATSRATLPAPPRRPGVERPRGPLPGHARPRPRRRPEPRPRPAIYAGLSRRALVVCVDTALRSLLRYGARAGLPRRRRPAVLELAPSRRPRRRPRPSSCPRAAAWPAVFRAPRRGAFLGGSLFPLGRRIEAFAGEQGPPRARAARSRRAPGTSAASWAARPYGWPAWTSAIPEGRPTPGRASSSSAPSPRGDRLEPAASAQAAALVGGRASRRPRPTAAACAPTSGWPLRLVVREPPRPAPARRRRSRLSPEGLAVPGLAPGGVDELLACPDRRARDRRGPRAAPRRRLARWARRRCRRAAGLSALRAPARVASPARPRRPRRRLASGREAFASGGDCGPSLAALDRADASCSSPSRRGTSRASSSRPCASWRAGRPATSARASRSPRPSTASLAESARYHLEVLSAADLRLGTYNLH